MATAAKETPARSMGHLALHYGKADDGPKAAKLLQILGLLPGLLLGASLMVLCALMANHYHFPRGVREDYKGRRLRIILSAVAPMMRNALPGRFRLTASGSSFSARGSCLSTVSKTRRIMPISQAYEVRVISVAVI